MISENDDDVVLIEPVGPLYNDEAIPFQPVRSPSTLADNGDQPPSQASRTVSPTDDPLHYDESTNHSEVSNTDPADQLHCDSNLEVSKKRRYSQTDDGYSDDGSTCPICLDSWTNGGEHRLCSLKCGHLFGLSCINRWLSSEPKKLCPTCKKRVNSKSDIRHIYAKKLIAVDTTEVDIVKQQLDMVTQEKNRIQIELSKAVCKEQLLMQQIDESKKLIESLRSRLGLKDAPGQSYTQLPSSQNVGNVRLYMEKLLELSRDGGCRVLDCRNNLDLIVASMKSPNSFFNGFGVRKINITNYKPTGFIGLHSGPIRDIKFHEQMPLLLSVSLDKVIKILDVNSNTNVISITTSTPLWSCCWETANTLYVGDQQGSVTKYDIRQMTEPLAVIDVIGDMSPVVSVAAVDRSADFAQHGGVITCKLNTAWFFENYSGEYIRMPLPIEGPFVSMSYQKENRLLLVSTRPNVRAPYARHVVSNLTRDLSSVRCDTVHSFHGGSVQRMLSRSCFLTNKSTYVAAYQDNQKCVSIWNVSTGHRISSIPARDPVIDLCGIQTGTSNFLLSLTERKLEFFKFVD